MVAMLARGVGLFTLVVTVGVFGCGAAEQDAQTGGDDPAGEVSQSGSDCVQIVQKSTMRGIGFPFHASEDVFTDIGWVSDSQFPYFHWCMRLVSTLKFKFTPLLHDDRYLDAYTSSLDNKVVVRGQQNDNSQLWSVYPDAPLSDAYRMVQVSTGRFLDAYTNMPGGGTGRAVTRTHQLDDTQRWYFVPGNCSCP